MTADQSRVLRGDHCRCSGCGERFNSTKAFDRHRRGDYQGGDRRCLTPEGMAAAGMSQNSGGWWITAANQRPDGSIRRDSVGGERDEPQGEVLHAQY